jgi:hypothetical protein
LPPSRTRKEDPPQASLSTKCLRRNEDKREERRRGNKIRRNAKKKIRKDESKEKN